jgi:uncharacterized protein YrzB (UPF0473 family)
MSENERPVSPIDALYDEENCDVIVLFNEHGEPVSFEQIALIPILSQTYVILKPVIPFEGMGEDEGLVFSIETNESGEEYLALATDEDVIDQVFKIYDALMEGENVDD